MNILYPLFILTCLMTTVVGNPSSLSEPGSLSSTEANYDGNALVLKGHVVLDHGLGKMMAEEASLQRQETGKEFPFSSIQLRRDVKLALHQSAQILCEEANLDFTALKGTLLPSVNQKVVYTDRINRKKGGPPVSLLLSSNSLELNFCRRPLDDKKTEYDIETLLAQDDVVIEYLDQFHLFAHKALYRKELELTNKTSKKEFQGIITAYPKEGGAQCKLVYKEQEISSDMVDIDLVHSKLSLLHPHGSLPTSLTSTPSASLRFQSDYLYWDYNKQLLTLKGKITIEEASMGLLETQEELQLHLNTVNGKTDLNKILTQGFSTLKYTDSNHYSHRLSTHGSIQVDREKLRASIESPEKEGIVSEHKQLCYEGDTFTVFSDSAVIDYSIDDSQMLPSMITLKGNIRLSSHDPKAHKRLGCADRLSYSATTRTFILSANPGKKVLFWDDVQGMHLSAPEVHITTDPVTGEQQVKGIGAVQFSFTSEEQNKLQKLFPELKKPL